MSGLSQPMIKLTRPSGIKQTTQTLLGAWFLPLAKLAGGVTGLGAGVEGVAELVKRFRPDESPHEAGWRLVYAGLERAIDEAAAPLRDFPASPERLPLEHLMQLGGARITFDPIEIPPDFLKQPKDLALLGQVGPILEGALTHLGLDARMAAARAGLLPGLFVAALADLWSKHPGSLEALEGLTDSPFHLAARQERFWPYYREKLDRDLARPLFGGRLSLCDLYQPLRGYRREREDSQPGFTYHLVDLKSAFDSWLESFDPDDVIRVVTGGPGSGKSSFVKWWAAEVLRREPVRPVLVVPLHRLRTFDLEAEIERFARNEGFAKNPVGVHECEPRLLLVLDGLDELDADQTRGQAAASRLVLDVHRLLTEVNGRDGRDLRVVLAGREVIVAALENEIGEAERQIFHVLGYLNRNARQGTDEGRHAAMSWLDPANLRFVDQRRTWWQVWNSSRGDTSEDAPAAIAGNTQLSELSDQPLLNYLLALAHSHDPDLLDAEAQINTVYAALLRHVWRRSWGMDAHSTRIRAQIPGLRGLSEADFKRVFESIGLAVWQYGGGRSITLATVKKVANAEGIRQQLSAVRAAAKDEALDLLTAFYFKREGAAETFELTHKSFGEYFVASRLMRLIKELHDQLGEDEIDGPEALRRWYRWTHAARITPEIIGFLEGELRDLSLDAVQALRATLIRLFNRNLESGMPLVGGGDVPPPRDFREAQRFHAAAELTLLAVIGACGMVLTEKTEGRPLEDRRAVVQWAPAWPDRDHERGGVRRTSAWDLLRCLEAGTPLDPIVRRCMQGMNLDQQVLRTYLAAMNLMFTSAKSTDFERMDLSESKLQGAILSGANLNHTNLSGARLRDVDFSGAELSYSNLKHSSLSDADLRDAHLEFSDVSCSNLSDAKLCRAKLLRADLHEAHLVGADLREADFSYAILQGAWLSNAEVDGAIFRGACLVDANLSGLDLRGADLGGAELSNATLSNADLIGVDLTGVDLSDARLDGAKLSRVDLSRANLTNADFSGVDLRSTHGLTKAQLAAARDVDWSKIPADLPEE